MFRRAFGSVPRHHVLRSPANFRKFFSITEPEVQVPVPERDGCVFVDSIFPVLLGRFDLRRYFVAPQKDTLLTNLQKKLSNVKTHDLRILSVDPHPKDGGVFVKFKYRASGAEEPALNVIEESLRQEARMNGGIATWLGPRTPNVWLVKGSPWTEDIIGRSASGILKVSFEGPDVPEETLYRLFRPYGRIEELTQPTPVPAGMQRFSTIYFNRIHSATVARNVIYGLQVPTSGGLTRLRISYTSPIEAHIIRDWITNHPRIFLPVLFFLLGTLTYTIFDPIRILMVEAKLLDWFDLKEFKVYKWLRANTLERIYSKSEALPADKQIWKEREDAERAIQAYLSDLPSTVTFVHGPQGSGKSTMIASALKSAERKSLVIDCRELSKASSDAQLVAGLAKQTGYWPIFSFLNSLNNLIDLASVGLIGQKAGLSRSVDEQLQQILDTVAVALRNVNDKQYKAITKKIKAKERGKPTDQLDKKKASQSDESLIEKAIAPPDADQEQAQKTSLTDSGRKKENEGNEIQAVEALPIVVIRNFAGKTAREDLLNGLAQWAAKLAENQIAHVIVISDNRENSKKVAKALQSKPLNFVALYDADEISALAFVQEKLHEADVDVTLSQEERTYVQRLGGRSVDLESLINKVRSGMGVKEAVEDIVNRGVGELRKNAFGDDAEDAKNFPWTRGQAWTLLNLLSRNPEVPYHQILVDYPFKGDESPLRSMEHAELITIATRDGLPTVIRPGKPVYRWVFERLVNDPIFKATQEIEFNNRLVSIAETTIQSCEEELLKLVEIGKNAPSTWLSEDPSSRRSQYLLKKMMESERKLEVLERKNTELKKTLSKLS
ncbi:RNA12 protein-domain-containing protein [Lentinula aff. lateritia]|uniref:RNA12 protein-domain-containing protein n=1 Tax=Lentinula aff. lateritia TaxID=2804960 RepID=A0ACC1UFC3_9AGAR|nr:RNA12 protein-domain-containing protein [Lentinula aff. lateritia]